MKYKSTRGPEIVSSSQAILDGIAKDGGLYIPTTIPKLSLETVQGLSYQDIAFEILKLYFSDFTDEALRDAAYKAYNQQNFTHPEITGVRNLDDNTQFLELFYGKTSAFKDQALSLYPYLLKLAMKKHDIKHLSILTATSGDTGKAAMEAIQDIQGLSIAVLYPKDGTSYIQKLQMQTQLGDNVYPIGIDGNFDDAQNLVKKFFTKHDELSITSANSINIARLLPQIIYYYDLFERIDVENLVDIYVPTGNFGNILAAFMAKEMGLPIGKLIVATNENNVLYEFFKTGVYDISNKDFKVTNAPSMDILISSNLERLLYFIFNDETKVSQWMKDLKDRQCFKLSESEFSLLHENFDTQMSSDEDTYQVIKDLYVKKDILIDPHTATAVPKKDTQNQKVIVSTASPYKFPELFKRLFKLDNNDDFYTLSEMSIRSHEPYPPNIRLLPEFEVRFNDEAKIEDIESLLLDFVKKESENEL